MSSIIKVDTIQDQAGNNIINESSDTITIGASGDTVNIVGTLQNNGSAIPGDISSVVAGTGLSGGGTTGDVTLNVEAAQSGITSLGTITGFTSTGIDDNATSTAMTIDSSEKVTMTRPRSNTLGDSALQILPSDTVAGYGFRMESTNNDLVLEKSAPSGFEAEILRFMATGGIALGGTGTANVLDDYEEGTWTPAVNATSGFTNTDVDDDYSTYTKIGNMVYIRTHLQFPNSSGNVAVEDYAYIRGLPFTPAVQDHTLMCGYRYSNTSNATGFTTTSATTTDIRWVCNYVYGAPLRNGGRISINFMYKV